MEEDEHRIVDVLEGKLSGLNIKEESAVKAKRTENENDSLAELKAKYNSLLMKAKDRSRNGDVEGSLKLYKKAYKIHKNQKVAKKIEKLEALLQESDSEDSTADDRYTEVGNGFKLSEDIYNKLYPYQKEGVAWFWKLFQQKKGGILGDDMGLGKTVQVISFLSGMFEAEYICTALIIMPVSLLTNWEKEFKRWAPEIRVRNFHGNNRKQRSDNLDRIQSRNGVCLTTYGLANTCHSMFSEDRHGRPFTWDYIILDEGHKIKNTANKTTQAIRSIPASNHFILTGTPIQNNLREMWALFDFVCEGRLLGTSRSFKQEYENPIVRARERDATAYEKRIGQEMSSHLRELIAPHFLRRTKDILEDKPKIPGDQIDGETPRDETVDPERSSEESKDVKMGRLTRKNDFIIWLYLSETQLQIYKDFVALDRVKEILMTTRSPLAELNVLKKICDHPRLLSTMACHQLGLNEDHDDADYDASEDNHWCAPPVDQLIQESGKMVFLVELLHKLAEDGHRTLVFSQSRKMLDIIQKVLGDKGIKMMRIDGTITSIMERESRINRFQNDPSFNVFLLTTQVGGVGLTLTAADRVVIFDPSWNPATDAQAVDRVYRIGQKNTVVIYRLITCGSLEEKIYRKQVFKQAITKQTTGSSKNPYRYFTRHELRELFVLDDPKSSKTQIQLENMHSANRVSDTKLDEHVAFLYSTDIFGISDHDLLFSKEAVATQEELHAASEMGEVIQAKIRRAADIMKAESSQATERHAGQKTGNTSCMTQRKNQTTIPDHLEIFQPSREHTKRFMPKKIQPSRAQDVIDLPMIDNEIDEDTLGDQFSAIVIDEDRERSHRELDVKEQIALDQSDKDISFNRPDGISSQSQGSLENKLVTEVKQNGNREKGFFSEFQQPSERSKQEGCETCEGYEESFPGVVIDDEVTNYKDTREENSLDKIEVVAVEGFPENLENHFTESGGNANYDSKIKTLPCEDDDDDNDDDKFGFIRAKDRLKRNKVNEAFSDDVSDDHEKDAVHDLDRKKIQKSVLMDELGARQGSPNKDNGDIKEERKDDMSKVNLVTQRYSDARKSPQVDRGAESESRNRSSDLHADSDESSFESDDEESEVDNTSRSGESVQVPTMFEIRHRSSHIDHSKVLDLSSACSDVDKQPTKESSNEIFASDDDGLSDAEHEGIIEESEEEDEKIEDSEEEDRKIEDSEEEDSEMENSEEQHRKLENIVEDRKIEDNEEDDRMTENSDEDGKIEDIEVAGNREQDEEDGNDDQEYDTNEDGKRDCAGKFREQEEDGENVGGSGCDDVKFKDDQGSGGKISNEDDRASHEDLQSDNSHREDDCDSSEEDKSKESEETKTSCTEEESPDDSDGKTGKKLLVISDDESTGDETEKENIPLNTSPRKVHIEARKSEKVLQPTADRHSKAKTSCCPRGKHVSERIDIHRCPCVMSTKEQEAYKMHVNSGRRYEKSNQLQFALKHFLNAYNLCDSDERLHTKLKQVYQAVKPNHRN